MTSLPRDEGVTEMSGVIAFSFVAGFVAGIFFMDILAWTMP